MNVFYFPNVKEKATATDVGGKIAMDVNIAGGSFSISEGAAGAEGSPAPAESKVIAGLDPSGNIKTLRSDAGGILYTKEVGYSIVDFLDTPLLDASSTNIPASASSPLQVVASLAAATHLIKIADTTGAFIGVYTGAAASEVLRGIINPGMDGTLPFSFPAGTRVSIRNLENTALSAGNLVMQFLG